MSGEVSVVSQSAEVSVVSSQDAVLVVEVGQQGPRGAPGAGTRVQPTAPVFAPGEAGLWIQTGLGVGGTDVTFWVEDGL